MMEADIRTFEELQANANRAMGTQPVVSIFNAPRATVQPTVNDRDSEYDYPDDGELDEEGLNGTRF